MSVQQMTVEYEVPVAVDGTTPAPPFSFDPKSPDFKKADPDGIVRFTAAEMLALTGGRLGLFDPDFGVGGTFADRFLHMLEVRTAGGGAAATIAVVDARDPNLPGQEEVLAPSPEADFFSDDCIFVPQGSAVAFAGFNPTPAQPVVIRINVVQWGSVEDYAHLLRACCCEEVGDGDGDGDGDCCPPSVLDMNRATPLEQGESVILSLPGCNLTEPMTGVVTNDPLSPPPISGIPTVNGVTVNQGTFPLPDVVEIDLNTSDADGSYMLILTNDCGCCTVTPISVTGGGPG